MSNWSFQWITDWDKIWSDDFLQQWNTWMDQSWSSHVFFHPALVRAWVDTYRSLWNIEPLFLIAKNSETTAFLPLLLWRRNWKNALLKEIIPSGYSDFDYHDPILVGPKLDLNESDFWPGLLEELNRLGLQFDTVNIAGIREHFAGQGEEWGDDEPCPYSDISGFSHPDLYLPNLKASSRGDLRRQIRRLQEQGELSYFVYSKNDLCEALAALPMFLHLYAARWPNAYMTPHLHENLLKYGLKDGCIHFSELRLEGKTIARRFSFIDNQRYYSYMSVIDQEFSNFSPGKVLMLFNYQNAIQLKLSVFDHLRGDEAYKNEWTKSVVKLKRLIARRNQVSSRMKCFMAEKVKPKLSAIIR